MGLKMSDIMPPKSEPAARPRPILAPFLTGRITSTPVTVADLAREKKLPEAFLRELGLEDRPNGVLIPYRLMDGSPAPRQRLRTALSAKEGSSWLGGKESLVPYGLDRLLDAREEGFLVISEGETDCWALWRHGIPAVGIPGAGLTKLIQKEHLLGIPEVYYWREPDRGGEMFSAGIVARLAEIGYEGQVREMKVPGVKDPAELHRLDSAGFEQALRKAMEESMQVAPAKPDAPVIVLEEMRTRTVRQLVQDDTLAEPEQVVEGLMALGELTVLGGPPKAMKSWTAKTIGLSIAGARPWMGLNVPCPRKVLYISAEGREVRLKSRFQKLLDSIDAPNEALENLEYLCTMGRLKLDTDMGEKTFLRLIEPFPVVIVDPFYRFISNADENSHKDQRVVQDLFDRVKGLGKCILLVHHTRKPSGGVDTGISELRGAGLDGFADGVLMLRRHRDEHENLFTLRFTLRNYEEPNDKELVRSGVILMPAPDPDIRLLCSPFDVRRILSGKEMAGDELKTALAEKMECSMSTVERAITKALSENLIAYRPKPGKGRGRIYFLEEDHIAGLVGDQTSEESEVQTGDQKEETTQ
jgi:hypothetical protein